MAVTASAVSNSFSAPGVLLTDNFPDLLFAACMVKSEDFVDEEENRERYDAEYNGLLIKAKEETKHLRRPDFIRAGKIPQPLPRPLP